MKKLSKDQTQKIVLGAMLLCGILYSVNEFMFTPLKEERVKLDAEIIALEPKIRASRGQIVRGRDMESKRPEAKKLIDQVNAMIPDSAPIAWCPTAVSDFFKRNGVEKITVRQTNEMAERDIEGYRRLVWSIDVPQLDFNPFGTLVANLENEQPLFEITGFELEAKRDAADIQRGMVTVQNIVRDTAAKKDAASL